MLTTSPDLLLVKLPSCIDCSDNQCLIPNLAKYKASSTRRAFFHVAVFLDLLRLPLIISAAISALTSASPAATSITQRNPSTNDSAIACLSTALISLLRPGGFLLPPVYFAAQLAFFALRGDLEYR